MRLILLIKYTASLNKFKSSPGNQGISHTLRSRNRILDLSEPVIMGILNATPDSFYNKGQLSDPLSLLRTAEKMLKDGASILDIGGASTKPGQELTGADEELRRVTPVVEVLQKAFPEAWLSIDTYHARVARETVEAGVAIVNDVSAGRFDSEMMSTVAALDVPYIAMHMQGTPKTMQIAPEYDDVVKDVYDYLEGVGRQCSESGISQVIVDPGFGFGKTVAHNFRLLGAMHEFGKLGRPVLAGLSRKSMICKSLKVNPEHALNGTTALHMVALQQGAHILRVHDVKEAMEVIVMARWLSSSMA